METLQFIFSDFWHFIGTVVLLTIATKWTPIKIGTMENSIEQLSQSLDAMVDRVKTKKKED